jgi:hypothetical protein
LQKKYNKNSFPNLKIVKRKTPPKNCMIWGKYVGSFLCCLPLIINCTQPCSSKLKKS